MFNTFIYQYMAFKSRKLNYLGRDKKNRFEQGLIKSSWMEYMAKAFPKINDQNAKNIVLHLSKHKDRE
jgi:hypothetical protein